MVKNIVDKSIQPHGHGITDEMDLMSSFCQRFSEFGGDNTAAAVGWVTCNADIHLYSLKLLLKIRFITGRTK
jgi:hypothetical protein